MARGSRSRASRAERRMQKERAERALQRGLPVPTPLPTRVPPSAASGSRQPSNPSAHGRSTPPRVAAPSRGVPLSIKLLGLGVGLLGLVYGLTLLRDRKPSPEAPVVPATISGALK